MSLFTNGNARITRLIIVQLGLAQFSLILMAVQGYLPTLDFLTPKELKITSFSIAVTLVSIRAGEMFFNKVASLFKGESVDPPAISTTKTESKT